VDAGVGDPVGAENPRPNPPTGGARSDGDHVPLGSGGGATAGAVLGA
jgi:hypothetical protein